MEESKDIESAESLILDKDKARKWAITISPPLNKEDPLRVQYVEWIVKLQMVKSNIYLVPEFAFDSKELKYRIHFHGLIEEGDPSEFQEDIRKLKKICFICLKEINNLGNWLKYCHKEINKTRDLLLTKNTSPKRVILTNKTIKCHKSTIIRQAVEYIVLERDKKKTVFEMLSDE